MTYLPEKLLQLEFVVKTIAQPRLVDDDDYGTAISIRFLDHPEQRVCEIPTAVSRLDDVASVIAVNVGKRYTFAMPADGGGGSCDPKPVNVSVQLYSLRNANGRSGNLELASGELAVKPTALSDDGCTPTITDKDDMTVPMTDCRGRPVAVLSVQVRAWITGGITVTPIDSPPVCQWPPVDGCWNKPSKCCSNSMARQPTPCCRSKPAREPTPHGCNKPPAREPMPCCSKPPGREPTSCYNDPPARKPQPSCFNKPPVRDPPSPCHLQCSGMDINKRNAADQLHRPYTDTGFGTNDQKTDRKSPVCKKCDVQRRIAQEAEAFISKVVFMVNDMHGMAKDTADMVD